MFQDGQDMMNADDHELPMKALTGQIIGMAMKVHNAMGAGYVESVYHRCMEIELTKAGISFESRKHLPVHYEGQLVGTFEADIVIVVDQQLIIELKATEALLIAHEVQLVNYLTASGIEDGLLLNFGDEKLQFRRKFRTFRQRRIALQPLKGIRSIVSHPVHPETSCHPVLKKGGNLLLAHANIPFLAQHSH